MWGKIQVFCCNSGWPADDNIQQLSHIYVLCQHFRKNTSVLWQQRWPADEKIQQLSHIFVLCQHVREESNLLWQSGWPADDNIQQHSHIYVFSRHVGEETSVLWHQRVTRRWQHTAAISHLCVVSTCEGRYKFFVVTAGDPPMITYNSYLTFIWCVNMWVKIHVFCGNSGWPADDNIQQLSHIYVLCQHVREDTSVLWQQRVTRRWYDTAAISHLCVVSTCEGRYKFFVVTAGDPPMITYSSYLTFMCCVNMLGKIQVYCGNSGDPPMKRYSSYLTFMCCVNMWRKIQVYCGNSGWPADDNIQQHSHIYVFSRHVREETSVLWQQRVTRWW